ncbi:MAG TPA: OmpH family outer membrane protein [Mariprofundaceae bacterium]|nr:OmpH family outer membrane protein [Mariprofundaceae bacterium]
MKIGYVDVKSAVENTAAYQAGLKKLEALKNQKQKELDAMSAKIDQAEKDILGQSMAMSPDRLAAKQQDLNEMRKNYNRTRDDANEELATEKNRLDMSVGAKLQTVLQEFGKEGGFDMILPRPVMLYADPKFDVTAEITKRLDKK